MCLFTRFIDNPKYKKNKKNGGVIPHFDDQRVLLTPITCGNCIECRKQKAREWQLRLMEDIRKHTNGQFVTLTFSNESITEINQQIPNTYIDKRGKEQPLEGYKRDNAIAIYAIRHFVERWRKKTTKSVRHWLITELGHNGTENIHLHGIIWTDTPQLIKPTWKYGFVWDGYTKNGKRTNYVNNRTVNYIIKYVTKIDLHHKYFKPRILSSPGVGKSYIWNPNARRNKYNGKDTIETYRTEQGYQIAMPKYWRNQLYTEEQREQLWINKMNKNERWVCGEKAKTPEEYRKLLEWHRERNIEHGYSDYNKDWSRQAYENNRRIYLLEKRTNNNNNKKKENKVYIQMNKNINAITKQTPSAGSIQKGMD